MSDSIEYLVLPAAVLLAVNAIVLYGVIKMAVAAAIRQTLATLARRISEEPYMLEEKDAARLQDSFSVVVKRARS
jgi:hypothetical protein